MYVRKEAVLSSQIEGTQSSLQDLLAAEAKLFPADGETSDVEEVINYVTAMQHGLARLPNLPVSVRLIGEIHEHLMSGVRGGHSNARGGSANPELDRPNGLYTRRCHFRSPSAAFVPEALGQLELFLHTKEGIPDLIKIGLAHAQFETIHPFLDGNGRVGRLLITFLLTESQNLAQAGALPLALLQASPPELLRAATSGARPGRLGGLANILLARCRRSQRGGNRYSPPDP